jgi:hypothetical protein
MLETLVVERITLTHAALRGAIFIGVRRQEPPNAWLSSATKFLNVYAGSLADDPVDE